MSLCESWLWSTWVKTPCLRGDLLIISACLRNINSRIVEELAKGKTVLYACPEREHPALYGKIASIVRSSKPKSITVVTVDGSPHCFQLHAAVNEAEYILGEKIERKHYVVVDGEKLVEISPDAVRVARYLHLVDELVKTNREVLKKLEMHSLEYRKALEIERKQNS